MVDSPEDTVVMAFNSLMTRVFKGSDLDDIISGMFDNVKFQVENPALINSRFVFDEILYIDINFRRLNLIRGSSYISLPNWLAKKKAIINPYNENEECFNWAVIAADNDDMKNPQRVSNLKKFERNYDLPGLEFPVSIKNVRNFDPNNEISVNLLSVENKNIYICRKGRGFTREINLLLISNDDGVNHYTAMKSLSRLLSEKNSKHNGKQYFCNNCL